jgi:succinyl-CoA synthetase beta subunit
MIVASVTSDTVDDAPTSAVTLSEAESRRLLADHGVPVSPFVTGTSADEAIAAMAGGDVDFPLAVKLSGASITHKTERGLLRLGVADEPALRRACEELLAAATEADKPVELLVSSMLEGSRELIAGVTRDPRFGLVLMLGIGGILAEGIGDVSFRLIPITPVDAEEMIDDLTNQNLLGPMRGEPAVDRDALVKTLMALARTAMETPGVVGIDVNPLVVVSGQPTAVDALVELETAEPTP